MGDEFIKKTTDGGYSWVTQYNQPAILFSIHFTDLSTGYAVGTNGIILKTTDGGVSFIEDQSNQTQSNSFLLSQNYPNPFNPSTTIKYSIPNTGDVSIKVFDVLGKEVVTLVNEEKPTGEYEVKFNAANLTCGIYFYQLKADNFVETKKMILLR